MVRIPARSGACGLGCGNDKGILMVHSNSRNSLITASIALVVAATIAADADAADGKVTVTFANWAAAEGTTKPAIEQVIAEFEKAHPDIQIKSEAISFSEIAHQLVLRVKSGNPPDVAQLAGNDTFVLATTGKLEPLASYVDADLKAQLKP